MLHVIYLPFDGQALVQFFVVLEHAIFLFVCDVLRPMRNFAEWRRAGVDLSAEVAKCGGFGSVSIWIVIDLITRELSTQPQPLHTAPYLPMVTFCVPFCTESGANRRTMWSFCWLGACFGGADEKWPSSGNELVRSSLNPSFEPSSRVGSSLANSSARWPVRLAIR